MPGLSAQEELILLRKRARRRLVGAIVIVSISTAVLWNVIGRVPEQAMKPESVEILGEASTPVASSTAVEMAPASALTAGNSSAPVSAPPPSTTLPESLSSVEEVPPPAAAPVQAPSAAVEQPAPSVKAEPKPEPKSKPEAPAKVEKPKLAKPEPAPEKQAPRKADPAAILEGRAEAEPAKAPASESSTVRPVIQLAALSDPEKVEALRSKLDGLGVRAHFSKVSTSKGEVTRVRVGPFGSREEAEAALKKLERAGITGIVVSK
ncbi:Cell division protein FtsN [Gulbenkiania indica]|uniref:Cell division protein FtsN n=1 Tax=Gulbenkiania indica TaxID=375574 RepID=A0A0K6GVQ9_9NEIS|nr:SPOR domain-containing protein [Gulbenkiania indica]CUA82660.1 Cell division protein FtsN [Gulbenkiania indica]